MEEPQSDPAPGTSSPSKDDGKPLAPGPEASPTPPIKDRIKEYFRVDRALIPIKLFYLTFIGGIGCVLPYVAVFLKQVGLSPQQIGLISGIRPIVGFISGPVWGILGDRFGIRKTLLLVSIAAWLAFYVGFYFIPSPERAESCPEDLQQLNQRALRDSDNSSDKVEVIKFANGSLQHLTQEDKDRLIESIGWIYDPHGVTQVLILSLFIIVGGEFFQSPTTALSDAGTLQTLGPGGLENYGTQRAFGAIGWGTV